MNKYKNKLQMKFFDPIIKIVNTSIKVKLTIKYVS